MCIPAAPWADLAGSLPDELAGDPGRDCHALISTHDHRIDAQ
jgi:hypothetical protein